MSMEEPEVQCGRERGDEITGEKHATSNYNTWVCPRAKDEGICGKKWKVPRIKYKGTL